jgi:hypothetical protein
MYGRTSKQMTKAYEALEKNKKVKAARESAARDLKSLSLKIKASKKRAKFSNKEAKKIEKVKPAKDRKLKKGEERNPGKSKLEVLKKIQARQQARRMDPDNFNTVKKEKKLSRRPQRKLSR